MEHTIHVLIVDDDAEIRQLLEQLLIKYNYQVSTASNGNEMFAVLNSKSVDLILLDVLLPGDDGFVLCRKIREKYTIPVIMVTAIGEATDRVVGLEMGADDYLTKPFNARELVARIRAVMRRTQEGASKTADFISEDEEVLEFEGWRLQRASRSLLSKDQVEVALSAGDYDLLCAFIDRPQKILSRDQLLDLTKNRSSGPFDRSIDIQVSRLRYKIEEDPKNPTLIKTVRGGGYFFCAKIKKVST